MKIGKVKICNFQSYADLEFDYANLGLSLVSGVTGSGKSSLMDAPAWILFGITSKDSAADEVKSWFADGPTVGTADVTLSDGEHMTITRIRGTQKQNDLYWTFADGDPRRGKDSADSQKVLDGLLGTNADLFLLGSYLHQFSRSDTFFVAKAKDRREIMEQVADLKLAVRLAERASATRKEAKKLAEERDLVLSKETGKMEEANRTLESMAFSQTRWDKQRDAKLAELMEKSASFESDKEERVCKIVSQLEELDKITTSPSEYDERLAQVKKQLSALNQIKKDHSAASTEATVLKTKLSAVQNDKMKMLRLTGDTCPSCLGPVNNPNREQHLQECDESIAELSASLAKQTAVVAKLAESLKIEDKLHDSYDKINREKATNDRLLDKFEGLQKEAIVLRAAKNMYQEQIQDLLCEKNPFSVKIKEAKALIVKTEARLLQLVDEVAAIKHKVASLTWLYDKSFELRGALMAKSVREINNKTNKYLERYFDGRLRVQFSLKDSDKLEVEINNSGYPATFKQLSGGERCMLTRSFSISLMKAAQNKAGIDFPMVMLDEALNGLDDGLKVKAFGLLQELEKDYETVLLIDHCEEFKNLFSNRFHVTNTGASEITQVLE